VTDARGQVLVELQRASALCDLRRYEEASEKLARVLAAAPDEGGGWCLLARARLGCGDNTGALEAARKALTLLPEEEWPHKLTSIALLHLGHNEEAIGAARECVRLAPMFWQAHAHLAETLATNKNKLPEALTAAQRAAALAPQEPGAHLAVGAVHAAAGQRVEAEAGFRRVLALAPNDPVAHNELARLQLRKSRFGRAENLADAATGFRDALSADPRAAASRHNLDLVVRVFLSRVSYLVFLDAWLVGRALAASTSPAARLIPIALLLIPAQYAFRFVRRLEPQLRHYLWRVTVGRTLFIPICLQAVAILCLLYAAAAPNAERAHAAVAAFAAAFIGRIWLAYKIDQSVRPRGTYMLSDVTVGFIALALLATGILVFAATTASGNPLPGGIFCIVCLASAAVLTRVILRRRGAATA
jgi:Flp pilus assembly protein TadD